jgi:hypothetical protein
MGKRCQETFWKIRTQRKVSRMEYKKARHVKLREVGKDEKWLQDRINEDTSILGLGDLVIIQREKAQYIGGRLDFLMYDPEDSVRYEIEIMLGTLDESHIIRTIEYWDLERRRYPALEHRAVIVAEDITNRFFNVIGLMNKAIPIVAIQLNAFRDENQLYLNFVKVLDLAETMDDEDQEIQEVTNRKDWEARTNPESMALVDAMIAIVKTISEPRVTYNKWHIAIGTSGRNFLWCHPRKVKHLISGLRVGEDRDNIIKKFEDQGIQCSKGNVFERIKLTLTMKELEDNKELVRATITAAENLSH